MASPERTDVEEVKGDCDHVQRTANVHEELQNPEAPGTPEKVRPSYRYYFLLLI